MKHRIGRWMNKHLNEIMMGIFVIMITLFLSGGIIGCSAINRQIMKEVAAQQTRHADMEKRAKLPLSSIEGELVGKLPNGKNLFRTSIISQRSLDSKSEQYNHWIYWSEDGNNITINEVEPNGKQSDIPTVRIFTK